MSAFEYDVRRDPYVDVQYYGNCCLTSAIFTFTRLLCVLSAIFLIGTCLELDKMTIFKIIFKD